LIPKRKPLSAIVLEKYPSDPDNKLFLIKSLH